MRSLHRSFAVGGASLLLLASACSDEKNPAKSGSGGNTSYENNGKGICDGSTRPANDEFCQNTCMGTKNCGRPIDSCCVMVGEPGNSASNKFLTRTTDTVEYADPSGAPPNLKCFDPDGYPAKPATSSKTAKLTGILRPFANGGCAEFDLVNTEGSSWCAAGSSCPQTSPHGGVKIEVYTVKRTGDPATDGALDQLVGAPVEAKDSMKLVQTPVKDSCTDEVRFDREYEYPDVPMNQELVIKTYGDGWAPLYTYNIYVHEGDPDYDASAGTYTYKIRALAEDDFGTIPTVAIGKTIPDGNAVIGGEVHDCDNYRLQFARVDVSGNRLALEYFNDSEDDPLPDGSRRDIGTGRTALYAAFDIKAGGAEGAYTRVAGTGLVPDGDKAKLVSLGYFDVRVFPNSVTSVTLRGLRPFQVP
ncbi:MAG: hypothetical protein U0263_35825 [Polyangiaceae bacterium]